MAPFRAKMNDRFERLEDLGGRQRPGMAGRLVMARSLTGNIAEELAAIEKQVAALEAHGR